MPEVACVSCGKVREITAQQINRSKYKGLCTVCNRKSHSGSGNPNWKDGKRLGGQDGKYTLDYVPSHPMADCKGYVLSHRIIAEKMLGRYLSTEEVVHHLDNNPQNNNEGNIVILSNQSSHAKLHKFIESTSTLVRAEMESDFTSRLVELEKNTNTIIDSLCDSKDKEISQLKATHKKERERIFTEIEKLASYYCAVPSGELIGTRQWESLKARSLSKLV